MNKNVDFSLIDKLNYLQGLLDGSTTRVTQGLPLTESNNHVAYERLDGHLVNTLQIISANLDELFKLAICP